MNTTRISPCSRRAFRAACLTIAAGLASTASAQFFFDDFEGDAIEPEVWGVGSTGSAGTQGAAASWAIFDTVIGDNNTRSGAVTHQHDFNPFTQSLQIVYNDLYLLEETVPNTNSSFYGSVGRYVGDEGGEATGALAASFGVGPYPGAFGFQVLKFNDGTWRLQILDMGDATDDGTDNRVLSQTQVQLDQAPSDLTLGIDGANATYYIQISGAAMGDILVNQTSSTVHSETLLSGTITNFTEFGILVSGTTVSRLSVGVFSGTNGSIGPAIAEVGSITVEEYDAPEFPVGSTSIFAAYDEVDGWRNTSVTQGAGFGWIYDADYPFVWSEDAQEWLYINDTGASAAAFWAWHYGINGWIWSSIDWLGYYWDENAQTVGAFGTEE